MAVETNVPVDPLSLEVPAPYVNKFQVLLSDGMVRISFAEGFANEPAHYRTAVMLNATDARELAQVLLQTVPAGRVIVPPPPPFQPPPSILGGR